MLSLGGLSAVAAAFGILVWVALPFVRSNQIRSYRLQSNQHLKQIALAMRNYHHDHGSYPPAYVTDSNGRPMHSWRVLLLPYLAEHATYAQYDLSKPWDEQTLELQSPLRIPSVYTSPADADSTTFGHTSFVVITGKQTMFPGPRSTTMIVPAVPSGWGLADNGRWHNLFCAGQPLCRLRTVVDDHR